ncbi:MAG: hypothetical protein A3D64_02475 [Candidatus Wildermuthbacteria bacterium RIFCSPHIGHO2_02_FULL_49_9]|uniref:VCBS repeat-containing protein n=1 Tax=Candidatus Wildermuthbacteria bacterium RIFCSPHIGHO2_02_FULL_49_9 TaxID=1802456 RepID=A0A1G2RF12_9BACT|nr:MAG: hypothetical protein A3D64_02475 [Candidatus Wildermuthbacteria bacterium RIFCSPHIGHO2_02_FULL_49_9]
MSKTLSGVIGIVIIATAGYFLYQRQGAALSMPLPANTSQLTKEKVLNGYNQCDQQFSNGEFTYPGGLDAYRIWELERFKGGKIVCYPYSMITGNKIVLADLDGDGVLEALAPAREVYASSGGFLYVFKNINGEARIVDSVSFGKLNPEVTSVNKDIVLIQTDSRMQYPVEKLTLRFVNGKLVKQ